MTYGKTLFQHDWEVSDRGNIQIQINHSLRTTIACLVLSRRDLRDMAEAVDMYKNPPKYYMWLGKDG